MPLMGFKVHLNALRDDLDDEKRWKVLLKTRRMTPETHTLEQGGRTLTVVEAINLFVAQTGKQNIESVLVRIWDVELGPIHITIVTNGDGEPAYEWWASRLDESLSKTWTPIVD